MPRVARLLTAPLLALALLLPAATVAAAAPAVLELAAEGGEGEEPAGLEPMEADATENEFRPTDYEANYLWGAAVGLLAIVLLILAGMGAAWYWLVVRPSQTSPRG